MMRRLLASLLIAAMAFVVTARAELGKADKETKKDSKAVPELKGDPKIIIGDASLRQAALKRQFESFRQKLAVLAGRLENGTPQDQEKAKSLKKVLKSIGDMGTERSSTR